MIVGVRIQIMGGGFGMKWLEKTDKRRADISSLVEESNRNEAKKKVKDKSPISPHLAHRDMHFFTSAKERGWIYVMKFTPKPFKYVIFLILLIVFTRLSEWNDLQPMFQMTLAEILSNLPYTDGSYIDGFRFLSCHRPKDRRNRCSIISSPARLWTKSIEIWRACTSHYHPSPLLTHHRTSLSRLNRIGVIIRKLLNLRDDENFQVPVGQAMPPYCCNKYYSYCTDCLATHTLSVMTVSCCSFCCNVSDCCNSHVATCCLWFLSLQRSQIVQYY